MEREIKNGGGVGADQHKKLTTTLTVFGFIVCALITVVGWYIRLPFLYVQTADGIQVRQRVDRGTPVTISYRHSVQKTMIYEYLEINYSMDGFVLKSTKYQSMGVGLPFSKDEGDFREEDGWFILDNINRAYPQLDIRNGVINEGKLTVGDKTYDLDNIAPKGKEIYLYVAPLYQSWYMKKEIRS